MRNFQINVNGSRYEVEVQEVAAGQAAPVMAAPAAAPVAAPAVAAAPAAPTPAPAPAAPVPAATAGGTGSKGSEAVKAPMPGTILAISVAVGQQVAKNEVVCILEAMKMENEIVATRDGVVAGIHTAKGNSVNAGDDLISLE
ncbi:MAG: acetyl-CoA carboxylase biotin carboxyl carrier protein subunit [Ruminococcaceae bacterium]|nr:acetyl-CoA carboxylase biotin carboxyl carrier protein subunit [Oscillospiraceae bacterium]